MLLSCYWPAAESAAQRYASRPWKPAYPEYQAPDPEQGSLYSANHALRLFADNKAHNVGDILTVLLVEQTNASKSLSTETSRESNLSTNTSPSVLGRVISSNGIPLLQSNLGSNSLFSGEGSTTQTNSLEGSVTVTVVERYPNGNLRVAGKKRLGLNQGNEFVAISGIVRLADISTTNTVESNRLAEAQISYGGKGPLADTNRMGWLTRFFHTPWGLQ